MRRLHAFNLCTDLDCDSRNSLQFQAAVSWQRRTTINRRHWLRLVAAGATFCGLDAVFTSPRTSAATGGPNDTIKVARIETFVLTNSWVFVKVSTDAGIVGWGEMLKDDAKACTAGALEVGDF